MNVLKALLGTKTEKPIMTGALHGETIRAMQEYLSRYMEAFDSIIELQNLTEMPSVIFNKETMARYTGMPIDQNNNDSPRIQLTFLRGEVTPIHACLVDIDGKEVEE
jgi:hypothetical protein